MVLSLQQSLFVEYYLGEANGNGTKAARLAGYRHPEVAASKLLRLVKVQAKIERRVASAAMAANEVLARLSEHASSDMDDYIRVNPDGIPVLDMSKVKRGRKTRVIKKVKVTTKTFSGQAGDSTEVKTEIELHNPQFALDKLAQYHGLYKSGPDANDGDDQPRIDIPGLDAELSGRQPAEDGVDPGDSPA